MVTGSELMEALGRLWTAKNVVVVAAAAVGNVAVVVVASVVGL